MAYTAYIKLPVKRAAQRAGYEDRPAAERGGVYQYKRYCRVHMSLAAKPRIRRGRRFWNAALDIRGEGQDRLDIRGHSAAQKVYQ